MKYSSKLCQNAFVIYKKKKKLKTYAAAYYSFLCVNTETRLNVNNIYIFFSTTRLKV